MKRLLLPFALIVLAGCSSEAAKEVVQATQPEESVELAGKAVKADGIALCREGRTVHVGDVWESALKVFPEPRDGYRLRSLPERFGSSFEAHGWETREGEGYGVITYKDLVVAALFHSENAEEGYANRLLEDHRSATGAVEMQDRTAGDLDWKYWVSGTQRSMVLFAKGKKGVDVTILMGDSKVLDALGASLPAPKTSTGPFITAPLPTNGESTNTESLNAVER